MGRDVTVSFASIRVQVHRGALRETKPLLTDTDAVATLTGQTLLIGARGSWYMKAKDLTALDVSDRVITVSCASKTVELRDARNERDFRMFRQKLQHWYETQRSETAFGDFLHTSAKAALGSPRSRVSTSRSTQRRRIRGTYGSQATRSVSTAVAPTNRSWLPEVFSDDEGEDTHLLTDNAVETPREKAVEKADDAALLPAVSNGNSVGKKRPRLQKLKKALDDTQTALEDDSDDDALFDDVHPWTTPATQHIVSPGGALTERKSPGRKQKRLSSFFPRKPTQKAFDPATAVTTPPRPVPRTPTRLSSPAATRLVKSARKSLTHDAAWLERSPAAKSPHQSSAERLFGKHNFFHSSHRNIKSEPEPEDPIQEFGDPTSATPTFQLKLKPPLFSPCDTSTPTKNLFPEVDCSPSLQPEETSKLTPPPLIPRYPCRGLRNLGNTCYLNSSVQMLCTVPDFTSRLDQINDNAPLATSLVQVAHELRDTNAPLSVRPRAIKDAMDEKTHKYQGFEQRDAHEFLSDLIDHVHEELTEKSKAEPSKESEQTPPTDDFRLVVRVCLKCTSCGYSRNKDEIYRHLSIDIVGDATSEEVSDVSQASVEQGLARFFQPETLEILCEKCKRGTHAFQTLRIVQKPKALLLHLKRFLVVEKPRPLSPNHAEATTDENSPPNSQSSSPTKTAPPPPEYVFRKNKAPVLIPATLSLDSYQTKETVQDGNQVASTFSLQSVVHHVGNRSSSGHYTADALRLVNKNGSETESAKTMQWISFDDGCSGRTSLEDVILDPVKQATAYILLYSSTPI